VGLVASDTNVAVGYAVSLTALIEGRTTQSVWDFGDGVVVSNRPYASHAWAAAGDYAVVLRAYNESLPTGVRATGTVHVVAQPVYYVASASPDPQPPYTSWSTAAGTIQDAVNAAELVGAAVLVTNGVYPGGVSVTKPLTLLSVNGPQFAIINGGGTNGCVSLTNGASLTGFTLTNGYAQFGSGGGVECASPNAFLTNCLIVGNSLRPNDVYGGGAYGGMLYNCTLSGNSAPNDYCSGAYGSTLYNCTLSGNSGSGANSCALYNCTLSGNSAGLNGGLIGEANNCTLYNCTLSGNSGGGANNCTLYNCTLSGNSAPGYTLGGGGANGCTLYNCTLSGNSGGGASSCALYNCIVYYNTASVGANYDSYCTLNYCCTTPLPTTGVGNLALDPQLASASHLSAGSPCRGAGSAAYATGTDIDGEPWGNPPSIGCDEYHVGAVTGPLSVGLVASDTNVAVMR
jgi:parallel beta-helix repeat protein